MWLMKKKNDMKRGYWSLSVQFPTVIASQRAYSEMINKKEDSL